MQTQKKLVRPLTLVDYNRAKKAFAANGAHKLFRQFFKLRFKQLAHTMRILSQLLVLYNLEIISFSFTNLPYVGDFTNLQRFDRDFASKRIAAVRRAVLTGFDRKHNLVVGKNCGDLRRRISNFVVIF